MADEDFAISPEVLHSSANLQPQNNELLRSVKRLSGAARGTVQKLHAINYLQRNPSVVTELILEVNALATILSGLEDDLLLENVLKAADQTPMWTSEHHKYLKRSIEDCDDALRAVRRAVRIADEGFRASTSSKRTSDYIEHFRLDGGPSALETIVKCSHLASKTRVVVRHTALSRIEILNEDEIQELLRLTQALRHPDLHAIWARKNEPFASTQMQRFILPSHTPPVLHIEPLKDETAATSTSPDKPSKPNVNPVVAPDCILTAPPRSAEPGKATFGEPSVIKPTPSSSLFANITSTSGFGNYSQPKTNLFNPHLEAYVMRPTVQTTDSTSMLSYADEPLRLNEAAMQAQMRSLGPDFSLMHKLLDLHPQQLNLMQRRAATRHGEIVSIQLGRPVDLQTVVGCMQVESVVYIISTMTLLPLAGFGLPQQSSFAKDFNMADADNLSTSLFDRGGINVSEHKLGLFGSAPQRGLFGNLGFGTNDTAPTPGPADPPTGTGLLPTGNGPLMCVFNDFPGNGGSRAFYASPEAYSRHLEEKGEACTYVEPTETKGEFQHFQTITANKERRDEDQSLEEIRLTDYQGGRRYGGTGQGSPFAEAGGLFGPTTLPHTATDKSEAKWYPKPVDSMPVVGRGPPGGTFAGYPVNNSGKTPSFNSSNVWGTSIGSTNAFRPGLRQAPSIDSPFGVQGAKLTPFTPLQAGDFCTTEHQHGLFCRVPPATAVKTDTTTTSPFETPPVSVSQKDPKQSALDRLTEGPNLRFGPAVGVSDPSDQSKWIMHSQAFCKFEHQHGKLCRVSPEEVAKNQRPPTFAKPAISSGFGQFASSSSESPFGTLRKSPFGMVAPKSFKGLFGGVASKSNRSDFPSTPGGGPFGGSNTTNNNTGGGLFGDAKPATGGGLFGGGASAAQPASGSLFGNTGGQTNSQNAGSSPFGGNNDQQKLVGPQTWPQYQSNHYFPTQPGCATFAQRYPPTRPGGLFSFSNASAPVAPSNVCGQPGQTAQPSETPSRPLCGLSGNPDTSTSLSSTPDQSDQIVPPPSGTTLFNNVNLSASASPFASSSNPVQATVVTPGTRWPGSSFETSPISKSNALQEYQQQLRDLEEHKKEAMRAERLARRGPHYDAALAELIGSAKPAPIDDVISALLSDDKSEEEKEAWYKAGLATLRDSEIVDATGAATAVALLKKKERGGVSNVAATSGQGEERDLLTSSVDVSVARDAEEAAITAASPPNDGQVSSLPTCSEGLAPTIPPDDENDG